jgi:hypothetical protein
MNRSFVSAVLAAGVSVGATADGDHYKARVDDHAPIGVMADHFHKKGEVMLSLRGMTMDMGDPVNPMMGPQSMNMKMVMAGMMYAPSDKVTLAVMARYKDTSMTMRMMGMDQKAGASDFGDMGVNAIFPVYVTDNSRFLVKVGANIPTGSVEKTNMMNARLGLGAQPGSGSWGFTPSMTYSQFEDGWSYGLQASAKIWLDDNKYGEQLGDSYSFTSWASVTLSDNISLSARAAYTETAAAKGVMPIQGDEREILSAHAGINTLIFGGHRFALEAGLPIWQDQGLNNLERGFSLMAGWQKSF